MADLAEFLSHFKRADIIRLAVEPKSDTSLRLAGLQAASRKSPAFSADEELVGLASTIVLDLVRSFSEAVPFSGDPWDTEAAILREIAKHIFREETTYGLIFEEYGVAAPWKEQAWPWPIAWKGSGSGNGAPLDLEETSALGLFGYSVAKANADQWPDDTRWKFLSDFMERKLPSIVAERFGDAYGEPMTTNRLRKVANVIAGNCGLRYRQDSIKYSYAISKWETDLAFLRTKYYDGAGLKFVPWPDPRG